MWTSAALHCLQLLDQQEAAQAAVLKAAGLKEELEHAHRQQLAAANAAHTATIEQLQQQHQDALCGALREQESALRAQLGIEHQQELDALRDEHAAEVQAALQKQRADSVAHAAALKVLQQAHEGDLTAVKDAHKYELATQQRAHKVWP